MYVKAILLTVINDSQMCREEPLALFRSKFRMLLIEIAGNSIKILLRVTEWPCFVAGWLRTLGVRQVVQSHSVREILWTNY